MKHEDEVNYVIIHDDFSMSLLDELTEYHVRLFADGYVNILKVNGDVYALGLVPGLWQKMEVDDET